jgi:hypothetical protein
VSLNSLNLQRTVLVPNIQINIWLASSLAEYWIRFLPQKPRFDPRPGQVWLEVLYQRMERTLVKFLYSGDTDVINCICALCYSGKINIKFFSKIFLHLSLQP